MSIQRQVKLSGLSVANALGLFSIVKGSAWRRESLLILCYHGLSVDREHEWRPALFMSPELFRRRMAALKRSGLQVLSLADGVKALHEGTLDRPSVVITFDDGFSDYALHAAGILGEYRFPATVYLTTWYVDRPEPVFGIFCSYLLWMTVQRNAGVKLGPEFGFASPPPLSTGADADRAATAIAAFVTSEGYSGQQKDELAKRLCAATGNDYDKILRSRVLSLMTSGEVRALSDSGTDIQLHTHRHRTPLDEGLFRREIAENRAAIERITGKTPTDFCYPSGVCEPDFLPWLRAEGVRSAVTCQPALASREAEPLLLPRMLDGANVTQIEFEAWLTGFEPRVRGMK